MPRVLLAWEFGGDLGHARRVLAIARQLRECGHEPLLAFADLGALGTLDAGAFESVQAPLIARPASPDLSPVNASDILLNLGFGDAAALAGALRAWAGLLRLFAPVALVADYAPAALLAARAAGLPRIAIGSGFSTPPTGDPMPALRSWLPCDASLLAQRDALLLGCVRGAFARAAPHAAAPTRAADMFQADMQLVCTWPEFDPFGPRGGIEYLGPQPDGAPAQDVPWAGAARPRIFAYLKPRDARFADVIRALGQVAGEAIVAAPGISAGQAASLSGPVVRVFARPVALDSALAGADLCVSHGGPGIAAAAAAHGVPQALFPLQLEQYLVARRICEAGWGRMIEPDDAATDLRAWFIELLGNAPLRGAAARGAATRHPASAAERIARALER